MVSPYVVTVSFPHAFPVAELGAEEPCLAGEVWLQLPHSVAPDPSWSTLSHPPCPSAPVKSKLKAKEGLHPLGVHSSQVTAEAVLAIYTLRVLL